jgi:hypothetical protein
VTGNATYWHCRDLLGRDGIDNAESLITLVRHEQHTFCLDFGTNLSATARRKSLQENSEQQETQRQWFAHNRAVYHPG